MAKVRTLVIVLSVIQLSLAGRLAGRKYNRHDSKNLSCCYCKRFPVHPVCAAGGVTFRNQCFLDMVQEHYASAGTEIPKINDGPCKNDGHGTSVNNYKRSYYDGKSFKFVPHSNPKKCPFMLHPKKSDYGKHGAPYKHRQPEVHPPPIVPEYVQNISPELPIEHKYQEVLINLEDVSIYNGCGSEYRGHHHRGHFGGPHEYGGVAGVNRPMPNKRPDYYGNPNAGFQPQRYPQRPVNPHAQQPQGQGYLSPDSDHPLPPLPDDRDRGEGRGEHLNQSKTTKSSNSDALNETKPTTTMHGLSVHDAGDKNHPNYTLHKKPGAVLTQHGPDIPDDPKHYVKHHEDHLPSYSHHPVSTKPKLGTPLTNSSLNEAEYIDYPSYYDENVEEYRDYEDYHQIPDSMSAQKENKYAVHVKESEDPQLKYGTTIAGYGKENAHAYSKYPLDTSGYKQEEKTSTFRPAGTEYGLYPETLAGHKKEEETSALKPGAEYGSYPAVTSGHKKEQEPNSYPVGASKTEYEYSSAANQAQGSIQSPYTHGHNQNRTNLIFYSYNLSYSGGHSKLDKVGYSHQNDKDKHLLGYNLTHHHSSKHGYSGSYEHKHWDASKYHVQKIPLQKEILLIYSKKNKTIDQKGYLGSNLLENLESVYNKPGKGSYKVPLYHLKGSSSRHGNHTLEPSSGYNSSTTSKFSVKTTKNTIQYTRWKLMTTTPKYSIGTTKKLPTTSIKETTTKKEAHVTPIPTETTATEYRRPPYVKYPEELKSENEYGGYEVKTKSSIAKPSNPIKFHGNEAPESYEGVDEMDKWEFFKQKFPYRKKQTEFKEDEKYRKIPLDQQKLN